MTGDVSGDLTGRRLGNYRIDGVLGKGGMSVMYKATDVRLGRKVALKVIGEHLGADAEFRERFVDEARNTSAVDHANVVPLYDFGELDGMLYIAMRLVDGADLASLIADGPISPDRTLRLLDQVADALDCLHERGLVHLDVKPANVLVTSRESAREHVYVADFGLTRRGATGHRTRGGDFLGSPTYAAPEHLRGEPLDGRTDQYALACVLYACLTGQPPFSGDVPTVIKGHLAVEPPAVSGVVGLPSAVDEVVRKGMAKNPADRYDNCVELITAARKALGPAAVSTTPPGPPQATAPREAGMQPYPPQGRPGAGQSGQPGAGQGDPQGGVPGPQYPAQPGHGGHPAPGGPSAGAPGSGGQHGPGHPGPQVPGGGQQPGPSPYGNPGGPMSPQFPPDQPPGWAPQQPGWQQQNRPYPQPGYPQQYGPPGYGQQPPKKSGNLKWLWTGLAGLVVVAAVVVTLVLVNRDGGSAPAPTTAPNIPVGPTGGATGQSTGSGPPPETISVKPSP